MEDIPAWVALLVSTILAMLFTPGAISWAKRFHLVTDAKKRSHPAHTHRGVIPRGGGIPIFLSIAIGIFLFLPMSPIIVSILVALGLLFFIGLWDDKVDSSPYLRFFANIVIASIVVGSGLGIPYITNPFGSGVIHLDWIRWTFEFGGTRSILVLADVVSVIWLVWMMNMVNWSKGVDGQLPGFVSITALFLGILSLRFVGHDIRAETVMTLSFIVAGAYLGFLPFNFFPQKIMPGYGGGAIAGFMLGVLSILSFGKVGTAILVLSIPTIDAVYTIIRRVHGGKSPFRADWGHFHHKLLEIGWGKRRIAVFYWIISAILGFASLFFEGVQKVIAFLTVAILLIVFMLITHRMQRTNFINTLNSRS